MFAKGEPYRDFHSAEDECMAKLCRQHILKEPVSDGGFVSLAELGSAKKREREEEREEVGAFGD